MGFRLWCYIVCKVGWLYEWYSLTYGNLFSCNYCTITGDFTFPFVAPTPYVMLSFPPTTTKSSLNLNEECDVSSVSAVNGRASILSPLNSYRPPSSDGTNRVGTPSRVIWIIKWDGQLFTKSWTKFLGFNCKWIKCLLLVLYVWCYVYLENIDWKWFMFTCVHLKEYLGCVLRKSPIKMFSQIKGKGIW